MFEFLDSLSFKDVYKFGTDLVSYLLRKWYFLLLAACVGAAIGYWKVKEIKPVYTASLTFVLSTETSGGKPTGLTALVTQFGLDAGSGGGDAVFSGDNIIELFKTRKLVERTLLHRVEGFGISLLEFIHAKAQNKPIPTISSFDTDPANLTKDQLSLLRKYTKPVTNAFTVFKKDKKLSYYTVSASWTADSIPYYITKSLVDETTLFFIETKTKVARKNLELLQKEADSMNIVLGNTMQVVAAGADRSFNMNPSLQIQRSGTQLNQARANAMSAAYTEVMRNLEIAKIGVQKETPLFQIIDESTLPLVALDNNLHKQIFIASAYGLLVMMVILAIIVMKKEYENYKVTMNKIA